MSNSFNLSIELKKSNTFLRLSFIIFSLALWFVAESSYLLLQVIAIPLLCYQFTQLLKEKRPYPNLLRIHYTNDCFCLVDKEGNESFYTKKRLIYDMEFFFLIELREDKRRKRLILFHDQLTKDEHRLFNIIEKIA